MALFLLKLAYYYTNLDFSNTSSPYSLSYKTSTKYFPYKRNALCILIF